MRPLLGLLLFVVFFIGLGSRPIRADELTAAAKLRTYCQACHAVGRLRFIWSEDDQEMWEYLYANKAPNSGKLWADGIAEVLNWPSDSPPPFDQMLHAPKQDWMPKGAKRLDFAKDEVDGQSTRRYILEALGARRISN